MAGSGGSSKALNAEREEIFQDLVKGGVPETEARELVKNIIAVGRKRGMSDEGEARG